MSIFHAILLAIIEGITEFLPISSTGHMVLMSSFLGIEKDKFTKLFEICIQFGAILAVVVLYWKKFFNFSNWQFYVKLIIAVIPALIFGKLFNDLIDEHLENRRIFAEFEANKTKRRAVERELEIIGEAMNRLLKLNNNVPLSFARIIVDLRNKVIHAYDSIDETIIWRIVIKDIPILLSEVNELLNQ